MGDCNIHVMTTRELTKLSRAQLFEYFCAQARYNAEAPADTAYSIRVGTGSETLFDADTYELRKNFFAAVEVYKAAIAEEMKRKIK